MTERAHLSIGEVLSLLQEDFPDVTISKIRFLESQGLLDPERTPSGYRKFYDEDIERLRWILRLQREQFLPLRVIKERLAAGELDDDGPSDGGPSDDGRSDDGLSDDGSADDDIVLVDDGRSAANLLQEPPIDGARQAPSAAPEPAPPEVTTAPPAPPVPGSAAPEVAGQLSLDDLVARTGLTARQLGELERFGLVQPERIGGSAVYGSDAVAVAELAARFLEVGVEPRHLRMYKVAAEREAGFFAQLATPLIHRRDEASRREALALVEHLISTGDELHHLFRRRLLRDDLFGR